MTAQPSSITAASATPAKQGSPTKIQAPLTKVRGIRVLDTDLVITLDSGETAVVPDGAIRSMTDPTFVLKFEDTEVAGSALLRQAGRMEIGELSSVTVSTPVRQDDALWLNGSPTRAADPAVGIASSDANARAAVPSAEKSWAEKWAPWATLAGAAGGIGIAAAGAAGGKATASSEPLASFTLFGTVTGGPVVAGNDLRVEVRGADGKLLGTAMVDGSGRYQVSGLPGDYRGALLVTVRSDGSAGDYRDEATGTVTNLREIWRAITARDGETQLKVNVTPLTELAVQLLAPADDKPLPDTSALSRVNIGFAKLFGIGESDITQLTPQATVDPSGGTASANDYGRVLALLSGLDALGTRAGGKGETAVVLLAKFIDGSGGNATWKTVGADGSSLVDRLTHAFNALAPSDRSAATLAAMNKAFGLPPDGGAPQLTAVSIAGVDAQGLDKHDALTAGDKVQIVVSAQAPACVIGGAAITLRIGGHDVDATFVAQKPDGSLVFEYTVAKGDYAAPDAVAIVGFKTDSGTGIAGSSGTAMVIDLPRAAGAGNIAVGAPIGAADWSLSSEEDTGRDPSDRITQKPALRISVTGQAGNTVHVFDDRNGNGLADEGEELGTTLIADGRTSGTVSVTLNGGSHSIGAYQTDDVGRSSPSSAMKTLVVDTRAESPQVSLDGQHAITDDGTPMALEPTLTLRVTAERGSDVTLFVDTNGNGTYDAADRVLTRYRQVDDEQTVHADFALRDGKMTVGAMIIDAAGNRADSAALPIVVDAQPLKAPTVRLLAEDDTGVDAADGITQKTLVRVVATGQSGATLVLFDDKNGNGTEDDEERLTTSTLQAGENSVAVTLTEGQHHLRSYVRHDTGRASSVSAELAIEVDHTAPSAPSVTLAAASDTGQVGDGVTSVRDVTLQIQGTPGAGYLLFADTNRNGVMDAGELHWSGSYDADGNGTVNMAPAAGATSFIAVSQDTAGNVSAEGRFELKVITGLPPAIEQSVIQLDGHFSQDVNTTDGILTNTSANGEKLTAAQLGIGDFASPAEVIITFTDVTNITFSRDGEVLTASDAITLRDVLDGRITMVYSQDNASLQAGGVYANAEFTVACPVATTDTATRHLNLGVLSSNGVVIFADGAGDGGGGTLYTGSTGITGQSGFSEADHVLGTSAGDLIFGDGSGGGASGRWQGANGVGGAGGGSDDTIDGGSGDDVIFGDGFNGDNGVAAGGYGAGGAGGYGGGGGGGNGGSSGGLGGIGGGNGATSTGTTGGGTALGESEAGAASAGGRGWSTAGRGAGVGGSTAYSAEFDGAADAPLRHFDNTGNAKSYIDAARASFLDGPGGTDAENRMFYQVTGAGNDRIDGGAGNDCIMGGQGNDTIIAGAGNDVMYGRGGGTSGAADNDTFVWHRGDAGTNGAIDIIRDFGSTADNQDRLQILDLLEGRTGPNDDLTKWIKVYEGVTAPRGVTGPDAGTVTGTLIVVDIDGGGTGHVMQQIFLTGATLPTTDLTALIAQGKVI